MKTSSRPGAYSRVIASERREWDPALKEFGGTVMQSWRWGEMLQRLDYKVERVRVDGPHGTGLAQVVFEDLGRGTTAHISRGPVIAGEWLPVARELFEAIDALAIRRGAVSVTVEPDAPLPPDAAYEKLGFVASAQAHYGPGQTVKVPLLDDQALLKQMRRGTRYKVQLAQRRGVRVTEHLASDAEAMTTFYDLLQDTGRRNEFEIGDRSYYDEFVSVFGDDAAVLLAHNGETTAAGAIVLRDMREAIHMFGASSTEHRVTGAAHYLLFEAMRWARSHGCKWYDLWAVSENSTSEDSTPGPQHRSRGEDMQGIRHFKVGFGGDIVTYPPAWERHIRKSAARSSASPEKTVALTIGMPTYNDFHGVYFSLQALRLYQDLEDTELIVVDNYGCEHTKSFVEDWAEARYILATDVVGTAAAKNKVIEEASGNAVLCCDSHVLFAPGVVARLKQYYRDHPDTADLLQGPLVYDDLENLSTHFDPVWSGNMWGVWATDPRGLDPEAEPFEIPMMGMGAFSCRREAWRGFNPAFRGFGGEEGYIHEKFRQAGARCLCLPWFRWTHRFERPDGVPYPLTNEEKLRNYVIGFTELGLDLTPLLEHFAEDLAPETIAEVKEQALREGISAPPVRVHAVSGVTPPPLTPEVDAASTSTTTGEGDGLPLVSCICLTYNRPPDHQYLLEEAIESFLRQTYPNKELIVLNDCPEQHLACDAPGVRVVNVHERFPTLGDKRNAAIALARGECIAPWDDDDISLPWRLSLSVEQLGDAGYYNPGRFWVTEDEELVSVPESNLGHNLSLFTRAAFEAVGGYPSISFGEDLAMHDALCAQVGCIGEGSLGEQGSEKGALYYIYRWGVSPTHMSSDDSEHHYQHIGTHPVQPGRFLLRPQWRRDYVAETRELARINAPNGSSAPATDSVNIDLGTVSREIHN